MQIVNFILFLFELQTSELKFILPNLISYLTIIEIFVIFITIRYFKIVQFMELNIVKQSLEKILHFLKKRDIILNEIDGLG